MVRITPSDARKMYDAYNKVYAPKEEPKPETEASVEEPVDPEPIDLWSLSKDELEDYGRTIGIELDRRHNKNKLIKQLEEYIETK